MSGRLETVVQDLQNADFLNIIRAFLDMLKSCLGPKGSIKILVSSSGISVATSSSSRLLNHYIFSHPICIFVSQVMKSQTTNFGDYGLYTGILTMSLLEKNLKQNIVTQSLGWTFLQDLSSQVHSLLELESVKLKLDFSTVKQFLPIVKAIISSKPGCGLNKKDTEKLSICIVKIFLNTTHDVFGDIIILNVNNIQETTIVNGVLYQIDMEEKFVKDFVVVMTHMFSENIPLLLFDMMLTDTMSERKENEEEIIEDYNILKEATHILQCALKIGVKIVACQKVVHESLRLLLQRSGVLLLDRLGSELSGAIEKMSGAKPISSLRNTISNSLQSFIGFVDSTKYVIFGSRHFVVLQKNNTNTASFLLHCPNDEAFIELKIVTQQALKALRQVICQPFVLPGSGCLEMWLATQLRVQGIHEYGESIPKKAAVGWLQKSLISISALLGTSDMCIAADTVYCHSWSNWDPDISSTCSCGLVTAMDVRAACGLWVEPNQFSVNELMFPSPEKFRSQPLVPKKIDEAAIVDVYISKSNAIKLALETCINMMNIGVMVYKSSVDI